MTERLNMTERYTETRYRIEVEHKPGHFSDNYVTSSAGDAYKRLQHLKEKYFGSKIKITKIIETKTYKTISEKDLLETKIRDSL